LSSDKNSLKSFNP